MAQGSGQLKILLVCDDLEVASIWEHSLQGRELQVILASSAREAHKIWVEEYPALVIIDMNTPSLDGIELCRSLRAEAVIPILLFTPRSDEVHLLEAYHSGADEVVAKPVSPKLFLAKVNAWLCRSQTLPTAALTNLQVGELRLDPLRRQIETTMGTVRLSTLEFRLLHLFMSHPSWIFEVDDLIQRVWGYYGDNNRILLKNVVYRLRRKIEPDPSQPRYILTEAGLGYRFNPD